MSETLDTPKDMLTVIKSYFTFTNLIYTSSYLCSYCCCLFLFIFAIKMASSGARND